MHALFLLKNLECLRVLREARAEALLLQIAHCGTAHVEAGAAVAVRHLTEFVPGELAESTGVLRVAHVGGTDGLSHDGLARVLGNGLSDLSHCLFPCFY